MMDNYRILKKDSYKYFLHEGYPDTYDKDQALRSHIYIGRTYSSLNLLVFKTFKKIPMFLDKTYTVIYPDKTYLYFFDLTDDMGASLNIIPELVDIKDDRIIYTLRNDDFFTPYSSCHNITKTGDLVPYEYNELEVLSLSLNYQNILLTHVQIDKENKGYDLLYKNPLLINKFTEFFAENYPKTKALNDDDESVIKYIIIAVKFSKENGNFLDLSDDLDKKSTLANLVKLYINEISPNNSVTIKGISKIIKSLTRIDIEILKENLIESKDLEDSISATFDNCYYMLYKDLHESNELELRINDKDIVDQDSNDIERLKHQYQKTNYKIKKTVEEFINLLIINNYLSLNEITEQLLIFRDGFWYEIAIENVNDYFILILEDIYKEKDNYKTFTKRYLRNSVVNTYLPKLLKTNKKNIIYHRKSVALSSDNTDKAGDYEYYRFDNCIIRVDLKALEFCDFCKAISFDDYRKLHIFSNLTNVKRKFDENLIANAQRHFNATKKMFTPYFLDEDPYLLDSYFDVLSRAIIYNKNTIFEDPLFYIVQGATKAGKSLLFTQLLDRLVGSRVTVVRQLDTDKRFQQYPLRDASLVMKEETKENQAIDVVYLKNEVNFDRKTVTEKKGYDGSSMAMYYELMILTNYIPKMADEVGALARRMRILPFTLQYKHKRLMATEEDKINMDLIFSFIYKKVRKLIKISDSSKISNTKEFNIKCDNFLNRTFIAILYNLWDIATNRKPETMITDADGTYRPKYVDGMIITRSEYDLMNDYLNSMVVEENDNLYLPKKLFNYATSVTEHSIKIGSILSFCMGNSKRDCKSEFYIYLQQQNFKLFRDSNVDKIYITDINVEIVDKLMANASSKIRDELNKTEDYKIPKNFYNETLDKLYKAMRLSDISGKNTNVSKGLMKDLEILLDLLIDKIRNNMITITNDIKEE